MSGSDIALSRSAQQARMVGESIDGGRDKYDFYPTPPEATRALLDNEKFKGEIWEPACGDGAISKVLIDAGYVCKSSDLVDRGYGDWHENFLKSPNIRCIDNIVTNPPFKLLIPFVMKACAVTTGKVAMLLRITALEGVARKSMFDQTPLSRVYVFSRRLTFNRGGTNETHGGGMLSFAWFVWDHSYHGEPVLRWLDASEHKQGSLL